MESEILLEGENDQAIDPKEIMLDLLSDLAEDVPSVKGEDHLIVNSPVVCFEQVIPDKLINLILEEYNEIPENSYEDSEIGNSIQNAAIVESIRNSKITWWYESHWISSIFSHYFNYANRLLWEYDLNHLDGIQVTTYDQNGHYGWHSDYGTTSDTKYTRKLSASLILSDPEDYEGGKLQIMDYHGKVVYPSQKKGTIIVFDSRVPHKVTKVKSGKRISLVSWMLGPKLR